jgi:nicotinamide riboside kinase
MTAPVPPRVLVVTGAESTGKSTLATALATALGAPLAPEAVRAYATLLRRPVAATDVPAIARAQRAAEDAAIAQAVRSGAPWVVLDTDLRSTAIYAEHYYGSSSWPPWLSAALGARRPWGYVLCAPDFPWAADPVRDSPAAREALAPVFAAQVRKSGVRVIEAAGEPAARVQAVLAAVRGG